MCWIRIPLPRNRLTMQRIYQNRNDSHQEHNSSRDIDEELQLPQVLHEPVVKDEELSFDHPEDHEIERRSCIRVFHEPYDSSHIGAPIGGVEFKHHQRCDNELHDEHQHGSN